MTAYYAVGAYDAAAVVVDVAVAAAAVAQINADAAVDIVAAVGGGGDVPGLMNDGDEECAAGDVTKEVKSQGDCLRTVPL